MRYHHEGPDLPSELQNVNCNHLGQYVIINNDGIETTDYTPPGYSNESMFVLCEIEVYGIVQFISSLEMGKRNSNAIEGVEASGKDLRYQRDKQKP